ncbi:efflux transporter, RND family, MFP subunit [Thermocrinis albus DSM 14484]|uniref:Efflux transporter, RND family, MFP subunit n=1 Tax=Thermocrinis albus (strain DSM 14484 / JCM 11386 / HI 11/12) TaxID=638303 RepID=D3SL03_THEAH|nr:efflux RND transporter periplasmic adaptor subunit [Thermocrinis albus]ADC89433.1 efflux transporter, RND family, MFP subunit [Thermocrinis albus DSM 14484]
MKMWKWLGFALVMLLTILWLAGVFSHRLSSQEVKKEQKVVTGLKTETVQISDISYASYTGNVVASTTAEISSRVMGRVLAVNVKEGDCVKAGTLLVKIDASDVASQVQALDRQIEQAKQAYKAAQAQLDLAQRTYERYQKLLQEGAVTQQEFDQVKAQYDSAKAQVQQALAGIEALRFQKQSVASNFSYTDLRAPFSGCVSNKRVDVGDIAAPGQPLLTLEKAPYQVEVFLPEKYVGNIKVGQTLKVYVEALGKELEGKVVELSSALDPITRSFKVKLDIPYQEGLRSGMYAKVLIPEKANVILVPQKAIYTKGDFTGVWVVKPDGTLQLRFVRLGERRGDKVEVLSGLQQGERVVVEGIEKACEGCKLGG